MKDIRASMPTTVDGLLSQHLLLLQAADEQQFQFAPRSTRETKNG
jgi:hypothetical protein